MNKTALLFLYLILAAATSYAKDIVRVEKCQPGADGKYRDIWESKNPNAQGGGFYYHLVCEQPGDCFCVWDKYPQHNDPLQTQSALVEQQIGLGIFSGAIPVDGGILSWEASSAQCYSFLFTPYD